MDYAEFDLCDPTRLFKASIVDCYIMLASADQGSAEFGGHIFRSELDKVGMIEAVPCNYMCHYFFSVQELLFMCDRQLVMSFTEDMNV